MKFFTNKKIWSKIVIVLIFLILFQFTAAKPAFAENETLEFAGKLMTPILSLVVTLGDAVMGILHSSIMGVTDSLLEVNLGSQWWEILGRVIIWVLAAAVAVAICATGIGGILAAAVCGVVIGVVGTACWDTIGEETGISSVQAAVYSEENLPNTLYLPAFTLSPEEIFQGKILFFNVDFFSKGIEIKEHTAPRVNKEGKYINEKNEEVSNESDAAQDIDYYYYINDYNEVVKTSKQDMAQDLKATISKWYVTLRNIALVGMMIVLLYIGIRMLLSTIASDKAKYMQMLQDWVMAIMLLFLMHYIMAFSVKIVQKITDMLSTTIDENSYISIIPNDSDNKLREYVEKAGLENFWVGSDGNVVDISESEASLAYPTNLIGYARIRAELANWGTEYVGFAICYLVLVMFTVFFMFTYLKRVLYMAFLTIIAPLVALTYPIDKIKDGSAQGFDKWFKEYIFNLLLQPLHLILYYVLIASAFDLSGSNIIYSIVAIGFMIPAEKLLRNFFGFEKAHTPGMLAGPAGAALAMSAMNGLKSLGKGMGGKEGHSDKNKGNSEEEDGRKPRMQGDVDETEATSYLGDGDDEEDDDDIRLTDSNDDADDNQRDPVLDAYRAEGFGQNANGEYFNPWTDEYDPDYDPHDDSSYNKNQVQDSGNQENDNSRISSPRPDTEDLSKYKKPKRKLKARAARSLRANGRKYFTYGKNFAKQMPGRGIRFTSNLVGGIAGGAIGLAAGIASGDPSKALQFASAGAVAGKSITRPGAEVIANKVENTIPVLKKLDDPKVKYEEVKNNRRYEELIKDDYVRGQRKEVQAALKKNFDKDDVKRMMDDGTVGRYIENGLGAEEIVTAERMRRESNMEQRDVIAVAKYAKRVGNDYDNTNSSKWEEKFSKEYQDKQKFSEAQANKAAKRTMDKIAKFNKFKKSK